MKWIARHPKFSAVAIIVAALFAFIIVSGILSKGDNALGRAAGSALAAVQKPFASGADWLGGRLAAALTDDALRAENESLKAEVERLEVELTESRLDEAALLEMRHLRDAFGSYAPHEAELRPASVLALGGSGIADIFTIDIGTGEGVERDTVVIAGGGLVGRVLEANINSSKVIAIIDENNKVGFCIEGRASELGVCYGNGEGGLEGDMLSDQADIHAGDRIVTSGLGGIYPAGVAIGVVTSAEFIKESSLLHIEITPAADFKNIRKVVLLL